MNVADHYFHSLIRHENTNHFRVFEHLSYDMIRELVVEMNNNQRLWEFLILGGVVSPVRCEIRRFPDWKFNQQEHANRG